MQFVLDDMEPMQKDLSLDMPSEKSVWNVWGLFSGTHVGALSATVEKPRENELAPDEEGKEDGKIIVVLDVTAVWEIKGKNIPILDCSKVKISGRPVYDKAAGSLHMQDVELDEIKLLPLPEWAGGEWANDTIRNKLNEYIRSEFGDKVELIDISGHPLFELFRSTDVKIVIEQESIVIECGGKVPISEVKNNL